MKRLFVFGCSYTSWVLPTWADLLGTGYDYFENWGVQGIGNKGIVERLSECIMTNNITEDDTIIVQWTDFHRYDYHRSNQVQKYNWSSMGGIWANDTHDRFVRDTWSEVSYVMHSMNYINFGINLLKNQPCNWFMTSSIDLTQDFDKFPSLSIYKKLFEDNTVQWVPYLDSIINHSMYDRIKIITPTIYYEDDHLTPTMHYDWLAQNLLNKLDVKIDIELLKRINNVLSPDNQLFVNEHNADLIFLTSADWTRLKSVVKGL